MKREQELWDAGKSLNQMVGPDVGDSAEGHLIDSLLGHIGSPIVMVTQDPIESATQDHTFVSVVKETQVGPTRKVRLTTGKTKSSSEALPAAIQSPMTRKRVWQVEEEVNQVFKLMSVGGKEEDTAQSGDDVNLHSTINHLRRRKDQIKAKRKQKVVSKGKTKIS